MAIILVRTKVNELEQLYSFLLTKYLESKGGGLTLTSLYSGVSKVNKGAFEDLSYLEYVSDYDAFILQYASTGGTMITKKDVAIQSEVNPKTYLPVISDRFKISDSDLQEVKDFFFEKLVSFKSVDKSETYKLLVNWKYQKVYYPWSPDKVGIAVYFKDASEKQKLSDIRQMYRDFSEFIYSSARLYSSPDSDFESHFLNGYKDHELSGKTSGDGYEGSAEVAFGRHYGDYVAWCKKLGINPATVVYYD